MLETSEAVAFLPSEDLERSERFFQGVLNLELVSRSPFASGGCDVPFCDAPAMVTPLAQQPSGSVSSASTVRGVWIPEVGPRRRR